MGAPEGELCLPGCIGGFPGMLQSRGTTLGRVTGSGLGCRSITDIRGEERSLTLRRCGYSIQLKQAADPRMAS